MNVPTHEEMLEDLRHQHINYVLEVKETVGMELSADYVVGIPKLNYEEAITLSAEAEKLYKSYVENLRLKKLLKELQEIGEEGFLEKYSLERNEPNESTEV